MFPGGIKKIIGMKWVYDNIKANNCNDTEGDTRGVL